VLWQAESGAWTLSVCVRGTFSLVQGREAVLADVQEPVAGDVHAGDDGRRSLRAASELVPYKPRVDVVLVGSAFSPERESVEALVARVAVGSIDKSIGIIGDRVWIDGPDGLEPGPPTPFHTMPIVYERAARSRDNPHGFDLAAAPVRGALALPNLENVDDRAGGASAGFGPYAPMAAARRSLLRPDALDWALAGPSGPAPARMDFGFFNAAPRDQQLDVLRPQDSLVLENLHREHARLETRFPSVRPRAFVVPAEVERGFEIPLRIDTVWIDSDRAVMTLSWRGLATVDTPDEEALGSLVIAAESKGREVGYAHIARLVRDGGMTSTTDSDTFTEARTVSRVLVDSIKADTVPTPGSFRAKRPLPAIPADDIGPISEELTGSDLIEIVAGASGLEDPNTITRTYVRPDPKLPQVVRFLEAPDFARIAASAERGEAERTLYVYGLGLADLGGVQRTCAERAASDPVFAAAFARALTGARLG
jgi:hypothetical protein